LVLQCNFICDGHKNNKEKSFTAMVIKRGEKSFDQQF